jgi:predicted anti-sigma-YlaC factor YlaD
MDVSNHRRMTCELARDELSAQLDGEQSRSLTTTPAEHLRGCTGCRNWQEAAHQRTRRVRRTSARPIPDRSPWILNAVLADRTERRPAFRDAHIGFVASWVPLARIDMKVMPRLSTSPRPNPSRAVQTIEPPDGTSRSPTTAATHDTPPATAR